MTASAFGFALVPAPDFLETFQKLDVSLKCDVTLGSPSNTYPVPTLCMSFSAAMDALHEDIFGHEFFHAELADEPLDSSPTLAPCEEEPPETPEPVNEPSASSLYIQPSTLPDCNGHTRSLSSRCHIRIININRKIYPERHSLPELLPEYAPLPYTIYRDLPKPPYFVQAASSLGGSRSKPPSLHYLAYFGTSRMVLVSSYQRGTAHALGFYAISHHRSTGDILGHWMWEIIRMIWRDGIRQTFLTIWRPSQLPAPEVD